MVESLPKVETNLTDMVSKSNQRIIAISKWNRDQKATSRDRALITVDLNVEQLVDKARMVKDGLNKDVVTLGMTVQLLDITRLRYHVEMP
ncbi:unnamed protein product [Clonostachys chloroleuca]|uniref:Uncharacterized protein n=1 Tax=Clonostachys chloroleuca TaxID=1926264 RepID=A0AA35MD70_9HYPO|nr:unnamed protein product [Clonostachys chloroleuca]